MSLCLAVAVLLWPSLHLPFPGPIDEAEIAHSFSLSSQQDLCSFSKNGGLFCSVAAGSPLMLRTADTDMKADETGD